MDWKKLLADLLVAMKPFEAQLAKKAWEDLIHPELQKLEGQIGSAALKAIVEALDPMLDKLVEAELAKLGQK